MDNSPLIPRSNNSHLYNSAKELLLVDEFDMEDIVKYPSSASGSNDSSSTPVSLKSKFTSKSSTNKHQQLLETTNEKHNLSLFGSNPSSEKKNKKTSSPIEIKTTPGKTSGERTPDNPTTRMSIFKVLTRRNSTSNQGKHKKLQDNWIQAKEPVLEGVTFYVKFLGSTLIEKAGAADAAEATKTVIQMVKAGQKSTRVGLTISSRGISILDTVTGESRLQISIYDIAHCSADANFPNVFTFIATNKNDINECYCFASRKRKLAKQITLTIAQAFYLAFEIWQSSSMDKEHHEDSDNQIKVIIGSSDSARSCGSHGSSHSHASSTLPDNSHAISDHSQWVHFDDNDTLDAEIDDINDKFNSFNMVSLSPFRRNVTNLKSRRQNSLDDHEDLLICFN